jgi:predicted GNAT superfamily acetyltransferase
VAGSEDTLEIRIKRLETLDEFREAVRLQTEIWGFEDIELLPVRLFVVATKVGGQAIGAFDGDKMIGFLLAIPGLKGGEKTYLHSHMMGVVEGYRNLGIGRLLKLEQRRDAIERGVSLVEWTFDPLELRNAHFNIERLGAVVRRYVLNQYGTTTSPLHGGLPTDRCVAEWHLASARVEGILSGAPRSSTGPAARLPIPRNIAEIRASDPKRAREIQKGVGDNFLEYFSRGLAVTGFERTAESGIYVFTPWDSESMQ